ncbi:hypothetical protein ISCGN_014304 [Ixodes scapularis]
MEMGLTCSLCTSLLSRTISLSRRSSDAFSLEISISMANTAPGAMDELRRPTLLLSLCWHPGLGQEEAALGGDGDTARPPPAAAWPTALWAAPMVTTVMVTGPSPPFLHAVQALTGLQHHDELPKEADRLGSSDDV